MRKHLALKLLGFFWATTIATRLIVTASLACTAAGCALDDGPDDIEEPESDPSAVPPDEVERRSLEAMDELGMPGEVKVEPQALPYYYNPGGCYYCSTLHDYADSWCRVVFGYSYVAAEVDCYHDGCYHFGHIRWSCGRVYPTGLPAGPAVTAPEAQAGLSLATKKGGL